MGTSEAKAKAAVAQASALAEFTKQFPKADKGQFVAQVEFALNHTASTEVFFKDSPDSLQSVFGSDRKYWSQRLKTALGLVGVAGFPYQLSPKKVATALAIPPISFTEPAPTLKNLFSGDFKIYAAPNGYFLTKPRIVFQKTPLKHTQEKEAKAWLSGPKMKYWPQKLNFAVFCATQTCGISCQTFDGSNKSE